MALPEVEHTLMFENRFVFLLCLIYPGHSQIENLYIAIWIAVLKWLQTFFKKGF